MELGGCTTKVQPVRQTKRKFNLKIERDEIDKYKSLISFYDFIPGCTLSLDEFEKYALTRLKVLRLIERVNLTSATKYSSDWRTAIMHDVKKQELTEFHVLLTTTTEDESTWQCRKFDHISHFLLRLAFARTEEQRRWFVSLELDLFRLRVMYLKWNAITEFLKSRSFPGEEFQVKENTDLKNKIDSSTFTALPNSTIGMNGFKVPFMFAIDLVRQRKVYLEKGFAYVLLQDLITVICSAFRSYLSECISMVKKNMYVIDQDQRIVRIIDDFSNRHTGNDYVAKNGSSSAITVDQLPKLSQKSFPLCMKSLYDVVSKEHHLKHWGRLQLGLFLKAIGVPLEEATRFWRGHFTRKPEIDGARFDKQYLYNIRHMYGQEGKRADYTPYSCMKVITSSVGPGDHHGCPFKHSDPAHLRAKLTDAEVPAKGVKEIMDLVENHHFQIACQKYFEWTHDNMTVEGGVNHPNQYFEESVAVLSGKKTLKAEEKAKLNRTLVYKDGRSSQQIKHEHTALEDAVEESMEIDDDEITDLELSQINF